MKLKDIIGSMASKFVALALALTCVGNVWGVAQTIAKIDDTEYRSLQDAVNRVTNGQTIRLVANCDETALVARVVSFTLAQDDGVSFTGSIAQGSQETQIATAEGENGGTVYTMTQPNRSYTDFTSVNNYQIYDPLILAYVKKEWEKTQTGVFIAGRKVTASGTYDGEGYRDAEGKVSVDLENHIITLNNATITVSSNPVTTYTRIATLNSKGKALDYILHNEVPYDGVVCIEEVTYNVYSSSAERGNSAGFCYWPIGYNKGSGLMATVGLAILDDENEWQVVLIGENKIFVNAGFVCPTSTGNEPNLTESGDGYGIYAKGTLTVKGAGSIEANVKNSGVSDYDYFINPGTAGVFAQNLTISETTVAATVEGVEATMSMGGMSVTMVTGSKYGAVYASGTLTIEDSAVAATNKMSLGQNGWVGASGAAIGSTGGAVTISGGTIEAQHIATGYGYDEEYNLVSGAVGVGIAATGSASGTVTITGGANVSLEAASGGISGYKGITIDGTETELSIDTTGVGLESTDGPYQISQAKVSVENAATSIEYSSANSGSSISTGDYSAIVPEDAVPSGIYQYYAQGMYHLTDTIPQNWIAFYNNTFYMDAGSSAEAISVCQEGEAVYVNEDSAAVKTGLGEGESITIYVLQGKAFTGTAQTERLSATVATGDTVEFDGKSYVPNVVTMAVNPAQAVAKIVKANGDTVYYAALGTSQSPVYYNGAENNLAANDTLVLLENTTWPGRYAKSFNWQLDLNGCTLTCGNNEYPKMQSANCTLTITDSSAAQTGEIYQTYVPPNNSSAGSGVICSNGKVVITGGRYTGGNTPVYASSSGVIEIRDGYFDGALYVARYSPGTYVCYGGTFTVKPLASQIAEGYTAVKNGDGLWEVGVLTTTDTITTQSDTEATCTMSATFTNAKNVTRALADNQVFAINIDTQNDIAGTKLADYSLESVAKMAVANSGAADKIASVAIAVTAVATNSTASYIAYDVKPEGTVKVVDGAETTYASFAIPNSELAGGSSFTYNLDVTAIATSELVKARHMADGFATDSYLCPVQSGENDTKYITVSSTHFSTWAVNSVTVSAGDKVVLIQANGGTYANNYPTIEAALAVATAGARLVLVDDIELSAAVGVSKSVTIVSNGHAITLGEGVETAFTVSGAGTVLALEGAAQPVAISGYAVNYVMLAGSENGAYTYKAIPAVASATLDGETAYYAKLHDALEAGKTAGSVVTLLADVDLAGVAWEPVGRWVAMVDEQGNKVLDGKGNEQPDPAYCFCGSFDGNGKVISNLAINDSTLDRAGLIGYGNGVGAAQEIKNLTISNATITARSYIGAVAGQLYSNCTLSNVHVKGLVQMTGNWQVGGVVGGNSYIKSVDSSIAGDEGSFVRGVYLADDLEGDNVGGFMGHNPGGNGLGFVNCRASGLTVTGTRKVGGLVGALSLQNKLEGVYVSDVTLWTTATKEYADRKVSSMQIGGVVGSYFEEGSSGTISGVVKNITIATENFNEGVSAAGETPNVSYGLATGGRYSSAAPNPETALGDWSGLVAVGYDAAKYSNAYLLNQFVAYVTRADGTLLGGYSTLGAAMSAVDSSTGDVTVSILSGTISENVSVAENAGKNRAIVIEGALGDNGELATVLKGTLTIDPTTSSLDTSSSVTVKNIKFDFTDATKAVDIVKSQVSNHYPANITVEGCEFVATRDYDSVGLRIGQAYNTVIRDCTFTGLHSALQMKASQGLRVENCTVSGCKNGFSLGTTGVAWNQTEQDIVFENVMADVAGYGIRSDANTYNRNFVLADCNITAEQPIVLRKTAGEKLNEITVTASSLVPATGSAFAWCTVTAGDDGVAATEPPVATTVKITAAGMPAPEIVAGKIGDTYWWPLAKGIDAAGAGVVEATLLRDNAEDIALVDGVTLKIAKNGFAYTGNVTAPDSTLLLSSTENDGATLVYRALSPVAKIGTDDYYESLGDAVSAVPASGEETTITILESFTLSESVAIPSGKNVVIDFAGKLVSSTLSGSLAPIENSGVLTLLDTSTGKTGGIAGVNRCVNSAAGSVLKIGAGDFDAGTKTLSNVVFGGNYTTTYTTGTAIRAYGDLEIFDCSVSAKNYCVYGYNTTAIYGGAFNGVAGAINPMFGVEGDFEIFDAVVTGTSCARVFSCNGCNLVIHDMQMDVSVSSSDMYGCVFHLYQNNPTVVINGGVYKCTAAKDASMFLCYFGGNLVINGGEFNFANTVNATRPLIAFYSQSYAYNVAINDGVFKGPSENWNLVATPGNAAIQSKSSVVLSGGNFYTNPENEIELCNWTARGVKLAPDCKYSDALVDEDNATYYTIVSLGVAKIERDGEETKYFPTLQAAVDAAANGDTIEMIADVTGESVTVAKSVTITVAEGESQPVLTDTAIVLADGSDVALLNLAFRGDSVVDATAVTASITMKHCDVNVMVDAKRHNLGRKAFLIADNNSTKRLSLDIEDNVFVVNSNSDYLRTAIFSWVPFADGSVIKDNVFGSADSRFHWMAIKFMNIVDGATLRLEGNTFYGDDGNDLDAVVFDPVNTSSLSASIISVDNVIDGVRTSNTLYAFQIGKSGIHVWDCGTTINGVPLTIANFENAGGANALYGVGVTFDNSGMMTAGTFNRAFSDEELEEFVAEDLRSIAVGDGTYTLDVPVAQIGTTYYATLADAIAAAVDGDTVQMISDVSLTGMLTVPDGKNFTLDLAGRTIVADDANWTVGDSILCVAYGATLTIDDSTGEDLGMIDTDGSEKAFCAIKMTNKGDDSANGTAALVVNGGAIYGTYYGISGNGTRHGTSVTINGGEISAYAEDGIGIYQPQNGSLVITGTGDGGITGATAVYVKSGTVAISGGMLWGTGAASAYNVSGNGANPTGDAIVIDNCGYPGGAPSATITGGFFRSDFAGNVGSYASGSGNDAISGFVSGGGFHGAQVPEEYCAEGYIPGTEVDEDGFYTVKQGVYVAQIVTNEGATTNKYETLADAIAKVANGQTIVIIADIAVNGWVAINKSGVSFAIDTNGKTIERTNGSLFDIYSAVTFTNSVAGVGAIKARGRALYCNEGADCTIESGSVIVGTEGNVINVIGDYGSAKTLSKLTMNGGTVTGADAVNLQGEKYGAEFVMNGGIINSDDCGIEAHSRKDNTLGGAKVTINDGTINARGEGGINVNGSHDGTVVVINGGTIICQDNGEGKGAAGIYQSHAYVTINGGVITGSEAIVVKGGTLDVYDGVFTATGAANDPVTPGSSGYAAGGTGDALYIEDNYGHSDYAFVHTVRVNVCGGTFISQNANAVSARFADSSADVAPAEVAIDGGAFKCAAGKSAIYTAESFEGTIATTGGIFNEEPADTFVADGYMVVPNRDTETSAAYPYTVVPAVAQIGDVKYASFEEAIADVQDGETIVVLGYDSETMVAPEGWKFVTENDVTTLVKKVYVAQIGTMKYESLAEALADVPADNTETVTIQLIADNALAWNSSGAPIVVNKNNVVIDGQGLYTITTDGSSDWDKYKVGGANQRFGQYNLVTVTGTNVTLKDMTIDGGECRGVSCATTLGGRDVTYDGVTYVGRGSAHYYGYGNGTITFTNCTMNTQGYAIHCSNENVVFELVVDSCTVNGWMSCGKATGLTIKDSHFGGADDTGKNGLLAKLRAYCNTTIENTTFSTDYLYVNDSVSTYCGIDCGIGSLHISLDGCSVVDAEGNPTDHDITEAIKTWNGDGENFANAVYEIDLQGDATAGYTGGKFVTGTGSGSVTCAEGYVAVKTGRLACYDVYEIVVLKTVTFALGENAPDGSVAPATLTYPSGSATDVALPLPTYTAESTTFAGWKVKDSDPEVILSAIPAGANTDYELVATWTGAKSIQIDAGGAKLTTIKVTDEWLEANNLTNADNAEIKAALEETADNGVPAWENYVLGQSIDAAVSSGAEQGETTLMPVTSTIDVPAVDTGFDVQYRLDVVKEDGTIITAGTPQNTPDLAVELSDVSGSAYYRLTAVVTAKDGSGASVSVQANNTIGVLAVNSSAKSMIVAVPWASLDDGGEISVSNLVRTATLTPGDTINAYDANTGKYKAWTLSNEKVWEPTPVIGGSGESEAGDYTVPRGAGVWLTRSDTSKPLYLVGGTSASAVVTDLEQSVGGRPAWNLVASPSVEPVNLSTLLNGKENLAGVVVPTAGAPKTYTFKDGKWGYDTTEPVMKNDKQVGVRSVRKTDDVTVPAGTGFWYLNSSESTDEKIEW